MSRLYLVISHCFIQIFSGICPPCFKSALVTPTIKKKCLGHYDLDNVIPSSILCFIDIILEELVLFQVSSYLSSHNLCSTFQSAYNPGHRTESALLTVINDLFFSLIKFNMSMLALIDCSSVFNTNDHYPCTPSPY